LAVSGPTFSTQTPSVVPQIEPTPQAEPSAEPEPAPEPAVAIESKGSPPGGGA